MRVTISATIPTGSFANLSPSIEVEAESFEEAERLVMPHIEALSAKYGEEGKTLVARGTTVQRKKLVSPIDGGYAFFDEASHTYTDSNGKQYVSGSKFCDEYAYEFPKDMVLDKMAKAYKVDKNQLAEMWELKGLASSSFGTGLHAALEMWGKYEVLGEAVSKDLLNKALHDQPILKKAVESFYAGRGGEEAMYEVFVVDMDSLRCGQIDRLLIVDKDKKICRVQDFKTNADLMKIGSPKKLKAPFNDIDNNKLGKYQLQLSFYASILQKSGWTVEGLDIFNYTDKWTHIPLEVINLERS